MAEKITYFKLTPEEIALIGAKDNFSAKETITPVNRTTDSTEVGNCTQADRKNEENSNPEGTSNSEENNNSKENSNPEESSGSEANGNSEKVGLRLEALVNFPGAADDLHRLAYLAEIAVNAEIADIVRGSIAEISIIAKENHFEVLSATAESFIMGDSTRNEVYVDTRAVIEDARQKALEIIARETLAGVAESFGVSIEQVKAVI